MKELFDNCFKNLALLGVWNREEFLEIFKVVNAMCIGNYYTFDEIDYKHPSYPDLYVITAITVFDSKGEIVAIIKVKYIK